MNEKTAWLLSMAGIAIVSLGIALVLSLFSKGEEAGKVLALAATVTGALVALGPALIDRRNGNNRK